jgi:hypothetical protein
MGLFSFLCIWKNRFSINPFTPDSRVDGKTPEKRKRPTENLLEAPEAVKAA